MIVSFVEECCFKGEEIRQDIGRAIFKLKSRKLNLDVDLHANFMIMYDPEDHFLLSALRDAAPAVNWEYFIFWRKHDQGEIRILDPNTELEVGRISVRRGVRSSNPDWTNVVQMIPRQNSGSLGKS